MGGSIQSSLREREWERRIKSRTLFLIPSCSWRIRSKRTCILSDSPELIPAQEMIQISHSCKMNHRSFLSALVAHPVRYFLLVFCLKTLHTETWWCLWPRFFPNSSITSNHKGVTFSTKHQPSPSCSATHPQVKPGSQDWDFFTSFSPLSCLLFAPKSKCSERQGTAFCPVFDSTVHAVSTQSSSVLHKAGYQRVIPNARQNNSEKRSISLEQNFKTVSHREPSCD